MTGFDMSLQEAMSTQRAVRRVKPDPGDDALVLRLIELALKAPTQQDTQAWEFIVVNLRQRIWHHQKLSEEVKRGLLEELKSIPVEEYKKK